jgi:hypothetical protein
MTAIPRPTYPHPDKRRRPSSPRLKFEPPSGAAARAADPTILALIGQVDAARLAASIASLTTFTTRHTLSATNDEVANWLRGQFAALGYSDVQLDRFPVQGVHRHNVICTKTGSDPETFVLIGAHFDSRMDDLDDSTAPAPGSDDNATGVAALLELARVMQPVETGCSIRFVAFSGEEQGLIGSTAYAASAHASGMKIRLMINLDMVGHPIDSAQPTIVVESDRGNDVSTNDAASQAAATRMALNASTYTSLRTQLGPIYASDYMPFEHYGYVCIGAFDGADGQPFYHSGTDTPDKVNPGFHGEVVRMVLATTVGAANW